MDEPQPTLYTERLLLRPFIVADAPDVQRLAGARAIADTTLLIPHPYPDGAAEAWIGTHARGHAEGKLAVFAITSRAEGTLLGAMGLVIASAHASAELGYWIGEPYWGRGYATEAGHAVLDFGFTTLGLHRIHAHHMLRNPQSGRVMVKLGMRFEGILRHAIRKWDTFEDVAQYAILATHRVPREENP